MAGDCKPYRPSNGSEGGWFMSRWCELCSRDSEANPCDIIAHSMLYEIGEPEYPREWVRDENGPRCTAFRDANAVEVEAVAPLPGQLSLFGGDA